jgi:hypothetical protein
MVVVWSASQPVSHWQRTKEAFAALVYHYQRVAFGSQFGMQKAVA